MSIVSDLQHKKDIMLRVPAAMAKFMDGFIAEKYGSRPEAFIDADRKFMIYIELMESVILTSIKDKDVSAEAKKRYYLEEIAEKIRPYKGRYEKFIKDSGAAKEVQVMIKCPKELERRVENIAQRTQCFKNYHDFTKIAFAYLIEEDDLYLQHESIMAAFLKMKESNLDDEVKRLREELKNE